MVIDAKFFLLLDPVHDNIQSFTSLTDSQGMDVAAFMSVLWCYYQP